MGFSVEVLEGFVVLSFLYWASSFVFRRQDVELAKLFAAIRTRFGLPTRWPVSRGSITCGTCARKTEDKLQRPHTFEECILANAAGLVAGLFGEARFV
jgi:hypothetical protein